MTMDSLRSQVRAGQSCDAVVWLGIGPCLIRVASNAPEVAAYLTGYFRPLLAEAGEPQVFVDALQMPEPALDLDFFDWPRAPGKVGRKDSFVDFPDGRVCRKVRTGMQYLLGERERLIFGPCLDNLNQVVNFIVSQYISWLLRDGSVLCHAAGVVDRGRGLGIAGLSGGGKSTLALRLLSRGLSFASNDRLLVRRGTDGVDMAGVPKMPRVNPGTLLNNPDLVPLLPKARAEQLRRLPSAELWDLEEKYDVMVSDIFGADRFQWRAPLAAFCVLNWERASRAPVVLEPTSLAARPDLLGAVTKSPGVFHTRPDGRPWRGRLVPGPYLETFASVPLYEIRGGVDFDAAADTCLRVLRGGSQ